MEFDFTFLRLFNLTNQFSSLSFCSRSENESIAFVFLEHCNSMAYDSSFFAVNHFFPVNMSFGKKPSKRVLAQSQAVVHLLKQIDRGRIERSRGRGKPARRMRTLVRKFRKRCYVNSNCCHCECACVKNGFRSALQHHRDANIIINII